jgi:hypothetical protein
MLGNGHLFANILLLAYFAASCAVLNMRIENTFDFHLLSQHRSECLSKNQKKKGEDTS